MTHCFSASTKEFYLHPYSQTKTSYITKNTSFESCAHELLFSALFAGLRLLLRELLLRELAPLLLFDEDALLRLLLLLLLLLVVGALVLLLRTLDLERETELDRDDELLEEREELDDDLVEREEDREESDRPLRLRAAGLWLRLRIGLRPRPRASRNRSRSLSRSRSRSRGTYPPRPTGLLSLLRLRRPSSRPRTTGDLDLRPGLRRNPLLSPRSRLSRLSLLSRKLSRGPPRLSPMRPRSRLSARPRPAPAPPGRPALPSPPRRAGEGPRRPSPPRLSPRVSRLSRVSRPVSRGPPGPPALALSRSRLSRLSRRRSININIYTFNTHIHTKSNLVTHIPVEASRGDFFDVSTNTKETFMTFPSICPPFR
jgi:hypothetical protein